MEALAAISKQLEKNNRYKQHGPGMPRCVAVHSKFIAVGTSRGLVLVWDHFQELRVVLESKANVGDQVTAVDVSPHHDHLIAGYESGCVILWDIIRGTPLKTVADAHSGAPIVSARFLPNIKETKASSAVTADTRGAILSLTFSKVMFVQTVEKQCLVEAGKLGPIVTLSVLHPPLALTTGAGGGGGGGSDGGKAGAAAAAAASEALLPAERELMPLMAFRSPKRTFLVSMNPEPKVMREWARRTHFLYSSERLKTDTET